ncbi:MAG: hypothetical protein ACREL3_07565, partial [Gemmatimonadales bacterium]
MAVLVVLLELHHDAAPARATPVQPERSVSMVYLPETRSQRRKDPTPRPPEAKPAPRPAPPPAPTAVPITKADPGPGISPTELPRVPERDAPAAITPERRPGTPADPASTPDRKREDAKREENEFAMVTEARRLFGPHVAMGDAGSDGMIGPVRQAGFPVYMRSGGHRCEIQDPDTTASGETASDGYVEGTVRNEKTGDGLPGAFLQVIGTPYVT